MIIRPELGIITVQTNPGVGYLVGVMDQTAEGRYYCTFAALTRAMTEAEAQQAKAEIAAVLAKYGEEEV